MTGEEHVVKYLAFARDHSNTRKGVLFIILGVNLLILGLIGFITPNPFPALVGSVIGGLYLIWVGHVNNMVNRTIDKSDSDFIGLSSVYCSRIEDKKVMVIEVDDSELERL